MKRRSFKAIFIFFLLLVLGFSYSSFASLPSENKSEKIKFGIYSNGIRVGSGVLNYFGVVDIDSKKAHKISLQISTFSILDKEMVYSALDFSYPFKVERYVRMFGKTEEIEENYVKDGKELDVLKSVNGVKVNPLKFQSDESFVNVLALIYKLRNDQTMVKGKVYKVVLPTQKLDFVVKESDKKIKVPLGAFKSYYIESVPPKFKIWLSHDEKRIPLRIQGLITVGSAYLAATEVSS